MASFPSLTTFSIRFKYTSVLPDPVIPYNKNTSCLLKESLIVLTASSCSSVSFNPLYITESLFIRYLFSF